MVVYDIKDSVSMCKHWKARVGTCVPRWLDPNYGIRVPYFRSGTQQFFNLVFLQAIFLMEQKLKST